ncbi:MAG: DMT family transporter [Hyphomonadaceae bacterium]|nr:DMT family transporter [Hyphomonadaceae bacterium]
MKEGRAGALAVAATAVGAALLGLTPIAVRVSEVGPQATSFWRFVFALPILFVLMLVGRPKPDRAQTGWLLAAGLLFGLEMSLWAQALGLTTVVNATLLTNMTPIFAALIGWLVLRERLSAGVLGGGAIALGGALLLALGRAQAGEGAPQTDTALIGDALGLSAAVGYAGYLLIVRSLQGRVGIGATMFWATLSACVFVLALALILGEELLPQTWRGWALLIALALVGQVAAQGLIAWGVGRLPIVISSVLLWLQPLSAALLSWLLFEEALGAVALAGAALILAGLFVVQKARSAEEAL